MNVRTFETPRETEVCHQWPTPDIGRFRDFSIADFNFCTTWILRISFCQHCITFASVIFLLSFPPKIKSWFVRFTSFNLHSRSTKVTPEVPQEAAGRGTAIMIFIYLLATWDDATHRRLLNQQKTTKEPSFMTNQPFLKCRLLNRIKRTTFVECPSLCLSPEKLFDFCLHNNVSNAVHIWGLTLKFETSSQFLAQFRSSVYNHCDWNGHNG